MFNARRSFFMGIKVYWCIVKENQSHSFSWFCICILNTGKRTVEKTCHEDYFLFLSPDVYRISRESLDFLFNFFLHRKKLFEYSFFSRWIEWMRFELGECDLHKCVDLKIVFSFWESFIFKRDWIYANIHAEAEESERKNFNYRESKNSHENCRN